MSAPPAEVLREGDVIEFTGCVYPAEYAFGEAYHKITDGTPTADALGISVASRAWYRTPEQLRKMNLSGLPIFWEHNTEGRRLGRITGSWVNAEGSLMVRGEVDVPSKAKDPGGWGLAQMLHMHDLELSLGSSALGVVDERGRHSVEQVDREVSLTKVGARPGTKVTSKRVVRRNHVAYKRALASMITVPAKASMDASQTNNPAPQAAQQPQAAQHPQAAQPAAAGSTPMQVDSEPSTEELFVQFCKSMGHDPTNVPPHVRQTFEAAQNLEPGQQLALFMRETLTSSMEMANYKKKLQDHIQQKAAESRALIDVLGSFVKAYNGEEDAASYSKNMNEVIDKYPDAAPQLMAAMACVSKASDAIMRQGPQRIQAPVSVYQQAIASAAKMGSAAAPAAPEQPPRKRVNSAMYEAMQSQIQQTVSDVAARFVYQQQQRQPAYYPPPPPPVQPTMVNSNASATSGSAPAARQQQQQDPVATVARTLESYIDRMADPSAFGIQAPVGFKMPEGLEPSGPMVQRRAQQQHMK